MISVIKKTILFLPLILSFIGLSQTGTIEGVVLDKEMNESPLPFANVIVKGSSMGTTTDFDGKFALANLSPGTYTLVFSFVGYETRSLENVVVEGGKFTQLSISLGPGNNVLDEVIVQVVTSREREEALLLDRKNAVSIKESIGAAELTKLGVSDAADATTKISGINKTENSGDVFVRGLGDRYLYTTLNGLPIPSDDVENKNINLDLFSTRIIKNVSVSKTASASTSADQASGNINVTSKDLGNNDVFGVSVSTGTNTNVANAGGFKVSPNQEDVSFGFYSSDLSTKNAITQQTWNPAVEKMPVNRSAAISFGKKINDKLKFLATAGQQTSFDYRNGSFRRFRSNFIDDSIPDAITWRKTISTSALLDVDYRLDDRSSFSANALLINKISDEVFEGGRDGTATIFEETEPSEGLFQFIRDQNLKKTTLMVGQVHGRHLFSPRVKVNWSAGYNLLYADEPNRIRNEVNFNNNIVELGRTGNTQQRKSYQIIEDDEYNALLNAEFGIIDEENKSLKLQLGGNFRNKSRYFRSQYLGVNTPRGVNINPASIDEISAIFTPQNFDSNRLRLYVELPDVYLAELAVYAGYISMAYETESLAIEGGLRYDASQIQVAYNAAQAPGGRVGGRTKEYNRFFPSFNVKYAPNEKNSVRLAGSITQTLPEFKEIAPFQYVSPTGLITFGNPDIVASKNLNLDLKWEYFYSDSELISVTSFYKRISDPINASVTRGSTGYFSYFNTAEKATVYGVELESRVNLITVDDRPKLRLNLNATRIWHSQDLKDVVDETGAVKETFKYKNLTETGLQGASDLILNTALNYSNLKENPLEATLAFNYASEKIVILGGPEDQATKDIDYNDAIVENGIPMLNLTVKKVLSDNLDVNLTARNILNPNIELTQLVKDPNTGIETNETVLSYTRGRQLSITFNYNF
jgi:TonB-dependent receptor